jgi:hypothetical protein
VLLCADLFTKEIRTFCGLRRAHVFFVLHLRTRTILLAEVTFSPHSGWLEQQVRNVLWECEERGIQPRFLLHDRDQCFSGGFDAVLTHAGVEPVKTPYHAPNADAFAERWIKECARGVPAPPRPVRHHEPATCGARLRAFLQPQAPAPRRRQSRPIERASS